MAVVMFKCPFCGQKVETPEENVGREGQCPECQRIFKIPDPRSGRPRPQQPGPTGGGWLDRAPEEYQEGNVLLGSASLAGCLVVLIVASLMPWMTQIAALETVIAGERLYILLGSAASLTYLALSVLSRKSLIPAVLGSLAWSACSTTWIITLWRRAGEATQVEGAAGAQAAGGIYLALLAALAAACAALFVTAKVGELRVLRYWGIFLVGMLIIGTGSGVIVYGRHLQPAISAALAEQAAREELVQEAQERQQELREQVDRLRKQLQDLRAEYEEGVFIPKDTPPAEIWRRLEPILGGETDGRRRR